MMTMTMMMMMMMHDPRTLCCIKTAPAAAKITVSSSFTPSSSHYPVLHTGPAATGPSACPAWPSRACELDGHLDWPIQSLAQVCVCVCFCKWVHMLLSTAAGAVAAPINYRKSVARCRPLLPAAACCCGLYHDLNRRFDIKMYPRSQLAFAVNYFASGQDFCRALR
jgi:hypothetical protein